MRPPQMQETVEAQLEPAWLLPGRLAAGRAGQQPVELAARRRRGSAEPEDWEPAPMEIRHRPPWEQPAAEVRDSHRWTEPEVEVHNPPKKRQEAAGQPRPTPDHTSNICGRSP